LELPGAQPIQASSSNRASLGSGETRGSAPETVSRSSSTRHPTRSVNSCWPAFASLHVHVIPKLEHALAVRRLQLNWLGLYPLRGRRGCEGRQGDGEKMHGLHPAQSCCFLLHVRQCGRPLPTTSRFKPPLQQRSQAPTAHPSHAPLSKECHCPRCLRSVGTLAPRPPPRPAQSPTCAQTRRSCPLTTPPAQRVDDGVLVGIVGVLAEGGGMRGCNGGGLKL